MRLERSAHFMDEMARCVDHSSHGSDGSPASLPWRFRFPFGPIVRCPPAFRCRLERLPRVTKSVMRHEPVSTGSQLLITPVGIAQNGISGFFVFDFGLSASQ